MAENDVFTVGIDIQKTGRPEMVVCRWSEGGTLQAVEHIATHADPVADPTSSPTAPRRQTRPPRRGRRRG